MSQRTRIVEKDTDCDGRGVRVAGETYWFLRFGDGKSGGGWPDRQLESAQYKFTAKQEPETP
ncbi:hypothetical protein, partial [Paraburkholderia sp. SIMBA_030]|uniref:hypothetical protein n=1 Tax=Paraburkholderia sp. SIMBA_030 TaxID=3085773 RepID=UPI00397C733D